MMHLPRVDETLNTVGNARYLHAVDLEIEFRDKLEIAIGQEDK